MQLIEEILITKQSLSLKKPYVLSFDVLHHFESINCEIKLSDNTFSRGEVVPLFGYSSETYDSIYKYLLDKSVELKGQSLSKARESVAKDLPKYPFSTTAILTAIDMFNHELALPIDDSDLSFVIPTSTTNKEELLSLFSKVCLESKNVLKIKLSRDVKLDISVLRLLAPKLNEVDKLLRLDANQAYSLEAGLELFDFLSSNDAFRNSIQYVEQPYPVDNWDDNLKTLSKFPSIPIMLDESIIDFEDLRRAHSMGINIVKLKLYKQGGIFETIELAKQANQLGIKVVLGNGVAGEITNQIENGIYLQNPELFDPVLESNGFKKLL